jgi:hypothetical protein
MAAESYNAELPPALDGNAAPPGLDSADSHATAMASAAVRPQKRRFKSMRSSNYDLNNTCNLTCEGCYYFVSEQKTANKRPTFGEYDEFFAREVARGVNYPVFSGGEPSLNVVALRAAAKHWSDGIIYTNGIKKIPVEVPFRIAISVWGAKSRNETLRGSQSYEQAFRTAQGDERAVIYLTINRTNVDDIPEVVQDCAGRGLKIAFNDFGMTTEYMRLMEATDRHPNPYMRMSTTENNLSLRAEDRARMADIIDRMIDQYPDTVLYTKQLNNWVHRSPAIHTIDPVTKLATDCAYLGISWHKGYGFDLKPLKGKPCCAPEFDCSDCRIGPSAMFTLLQRLTERMRRSEAARAELHELRDYMMRYHFWDWGNTGKRASDVSADALQATA